MRNLANVPDLETRCKDDAVWRVFGVEWLPVRFQFHSDMSQLCHGVARANLMEEDLLYTMCKGILAQRQTIEEL